MIRPDSVGSVNPEDVPHAGLDLSVTFTIKELLGQINDRLVGIDVKLDSKASIEHVTQIEANVEKHAAEIAGLRESRAKLIGAVSFCTFIAGGGGYLLANIAAISPT